MESKAREASQMAEQVKQAAQELGSRARQAGASAWERTKSGYSVVQDKTVSGAKATDRVIRTNPYQSIGIAFGLGLVIGLLLKRK